MRSSFLRSVQLRPGSFVLVGTLPGGGGGSSDLLGGGGTTELVLQDPDACAPTHNQCTGPPAASAAGTGAVALGAIFQGANLPFEDKIYNASLIPSFPRPAWYRLAPPLNTTLMSSAGFVENFLTAPVRGSSHSDRTRIGEVMAAAVAVCNTSAGFFPPSAMVEAVRRTEETQFCYSGVVGLPRG